MKSNNLVELSISQTEALKSLVCQLLETLLMYAYKMQNAQLYKPHKQLAHLAIELTKFSLASRPRTWLFNISTCLFSNELF